MSTGIIATKELKQITKICERVHCTTSSEPFSNHLYVVLKKALPSVHFTIDYFSLKPLIFHEPLNQSLPDSTFTMFKLFMHQHPGFRKYLEANQCVGSLLTEFSPTQHHKTGLYNEVYRPVGIEDQVWIGVGDQHELIAVSYSRETAYTEFERFKLSLIQPHVHLAWKNWKKTRSLEMQLRHLQTAQIQSDQQAHHAVAMKRALQSLTRRQREIVEQIAGGRTNQQISDELSISIRTVEKHVENTCTALGVRSRAAILYETGLNQNKGAGKGSGFMK